MGHFFDSDDLDFMFLLSSWGSPAAIVISIVFLVICAGLVYASYDECSDMCAPNEGRVLENECYCVSPDGGLTAVEGSK